jgi:hypothetical protein
MHYSRRQKGKKAFHLNTVSPSYAMTSSLFFKLVGYMIISDKNHVTIPKKKLSYLHLTLQKNEKENQSVRRRKKLTKTGMLYGITDHTS